MAKKAYQSPTNAATLFMYSYLSSGLQVWQRIRIEVQEDLNNIPSTSLELWQLLGALPLIDQGWYPVGCEDVWGDFAQNVMSG